MPDPPRSPGRRLRPDQPAERWVLEVATGARRRLLRSAMRLFEAPTWHPEGRGIRSPDSRSLAFVAYPIAEA